MKVPKEQRERIFRVVRNFMDKQPEEACRDYAEKVSPKRFRWDMLWYGCRGDADFNISDLYADGVNDDHIDTVLRVIMKRLNFQV